MKDGAVARVLGTIQPGPTFTTALGIQPAVLARYRARLGVGLAGYVAEEIRAVDFSIETRDGHRVRVSGRDAFLLDEPRGSAPALTAPVFLVKQPLSEQERQVVGYDEAAVGPGDEVEVIATITREVDPTGAAESGRGTPLTITLRRLPGGPLFVRNLSARVRL